MQLQEADQRTLIGLILAHCLNSKEVRQVVQLRIRSGRAIGSCVAEIIGMRPTIERRYVFIGSVGEANVENALERLTQAERNSILERGIDNICLQGATGRLGERFFTIVGEEAFERSMNRVGKGNIEARLRTHISESI